MSPNRWELPRRSFPPTRPGYLTWRTKHKSQAALGVSALLSSTAFPPTPKPKVLEDVACLVFLDDQLDDFEAKSDMDEDKAVGILRKKWGRMTDDGKKLASGMDLSERARVLIAKALEAS
ncbi:glutamyl-tRNA synthetase [Metarhizium album ARSEF 1941]|uniref:Glutamyl-tRNA synthetase n=1 Tax=Metarhizium album (strain ARSEF 1941) TaxID=1081103 RepID=A0A0B2WR09_METAS|nr:glutamyl-tRNA synthetase [Metarhizium album ARSEF 1941]KHN95410.1 glutamyl-tRNA synthetase [Metarhizium album ARSEF 1941]